MKQLLVKRECGQVVSPSVWLGPGLLWAQNVSVLCWLVYKYAKEAKRKPSFKGAHDSVKKQLGKDRYM